MLSDKLRALRADATLATVATATGLSISFLSDMERARTKPSLDTLVALAGHYKMSVVDLLQGTEYGHSRLVESSPTPAERADHILDTSVRRYAGTWAMSDEEWAETRAHIIHEIGQALTTRWIGVGWGLPEVSTELYNVVMSNGWRMAGQYLGNREWAIPGMDWRYLAHIDCFVVAWQPMPAAPIDDSDDTSVWWDKFYSTTTRPQAAPSEEEA